MAHAFVLAITGLLAVPPALAQYTYSTFAGIAGRPGSQDGSQGATGSTLFNGPDGIVLAADGTLYVTDANNSVIRKITSAGAVSTFVGTAGSAGVNDGSTAAPNVTFSLPQGAALDGSGNLYVSDFGGHTIRKISASGTVTTLAGTALTAGSINGTGKDAKFTKPSGLAVDGSGNVYVADSGNNTIRKITAAGVVTSLAGSDTAGLTNPRGVAVDGSGNVYVADSGNNRIVKITSAGASSVLAGKLDTYGTTDGTGENARFNFPNSLTLDGSGNLLVTDTGNHVIRKVTPAGVVTTVAGVAGSAGRVDGAATTVARFNRPSSVAVDSSGNLYVADYGNQLIRKVSAAGVVSTIAGTGGQTGLQNGTGYLLDPSGFRSPSGATTDASGNIYVTDAGNHLIRKIAPSGAVSLVAGSSGVTGTTDGTGAAARFNSPAGIAVDAGGNLFVADSANHTIRRITPAGEVTTYSGTAGTSGSADGDRTTATFRYPNGVALDAAGNLYVADYGNHTIRMIATSGQVSTIAGTAAAEGSADGVGGAARFSYPRDLAVDGSGNVYVADTGNHTVRRISAGGLVMTFAGSAGVSGSADGSGSVARFNGPAGVGVDASGNLYVADTGNSTLRKVTPAGVVSTIGGTAGNVGTLDGTGTAALFNFPSDVAVDPSGNLYIADNRSHTIRLGVPAGGSGGANGGNSGGTGSNGSGSGGTGGTSGGTGSSASDGAFSGGTVGTGFLNHPIGAAADASGNFYVCDTASHCIRKITSAGVVSTFAGQAGTAGSTDATGESARFSSPTGLVRDSAGNLYVTDTGNATIRKITSAGVVTTLAGTAGSTGTADGVGAAARFNSPNGITLTINAASAIELYVTDSINNTIRKVLAADGTVTTFSGTAGTTGDADGDGKASARFNHPTGIAVDLSGGLVVADTYNNTIRSIRTTDLTGLDANGVTVVTQPAGWAYTIAGSPGITGAYDGTAGNALFNLPQGVTVNSTSGAIFVADTGNSIIRRITPNRAVTTVAGIAGISGNRSGTGDQALFNQPQGIVSYSATALVVADTGNSILRSVVFPSSSTTGSPTVTTVSLSSSSSSGSSGSGSGGSSSSGGGGGGAPSLWFVAVLGALGAGRAVRRKAA